MRSKTQIRNAVDDLEAAGIVVDGVSVEHKAVRAVIDEDDEAAKSDLENLASKHICEVVHEDTAGGHEVYQLINNEAELEF